MANIIIIHGAWHTCALYIKLKHSLESLGHNVIIPDLPNVGESANLEFYCHTILNIINKLEEKPYLVGHSLAGLILSSMASIAADKISANIYLCAFLLKHQETINSFVKSSHRGKLSISLSEDRKIITINSDSFKEACFNETNEKDIEFANQFLTPQNFDFFETKLFLDGNYNRVKRYYIKCLKDNTIPLKSQEEMIIRDKHIIEFELDADHFPFLSKTEDLAATIDKITML